jgi:hypothetical protein
MLQNAVVGNLSEIEKFIVIITEVFDPTAGLYELFMHRGPCCRVFLEKLSFGGEQSGHRIECGVVGAVCRDVRIPI